MNTAIQKWGNSQELRLKRDILEIANLSVGDNIKVLVKHWNIIISPDKKIRKKIDLKKLLNSIPKNYKSECIDWDKSVGKEIW